MTTVRIADRLLAGMATLCGHNSSPQGEDAASLRAAPKIVADNVAEFYFASSDKDVWVIGEDIPNIAPPFAEFWVEARRPRQTNIGGQITPLHPHDWHEAGAFIQAFETSAGWDLYAAVVVGMGNGDLVGPIAYLRLPVRRDGVYDGSGLPLSEGHSHHSRRYFRGGSRRTPATHDGRCSQCGETASARDLIHALQERRTVHIYTTPFAALGEKLGT